MSKKQEIILDLVNWSALSELLTGNKTSIRKNRVPEKYLEEVQAHLSALRLWYDVYIDGDIVPVEVDIKTIISSLPPTISAFKAKPREKNTKNLGTQKLNFSRVGVKNK